MHNLGRWGVLFSVTCFLCMFGTGFIVHQRGYFIALGINTVLQSIDVLTSDALATNVACLKKNGFSSFEIGFTMLFNQLTGVLVPSYTIILYAEEIKYRFDLDLILKVALCVAVSDVFFYYAHQWMHRNKPELHLMHHCVKRPSFISNLIFHPLDLAIEFSGPVSSLIFLCMVVFKDPFAMLVGSSFMVAYYTADHDEYLKLRHYYHHTYLNSNYSIYFDISGHDPKDRMKSFVKF